MSLRQMCLDSGVSIGGIAEHLDALSPNERMKQMFSLGRREQKELFAKASESEPLTLDFFVPQSCRELAPVIHHGKNSLPAFRYFQKRFCRPQEGPPRLFGYNETWVRSVIGPGYFVAVETENYPTWRDRGGVVIDYFRVPNARVASGWPTISPNDQGLQRFVYDQTRDFMRRVSDHVSIGAAWKNERPMGAYFLLCREAGVKYKAITEGKKES